MIGVWVMMRWFVDRLLLFCLILLSVLMMNYCLGPQDRGFCEWRPFCYSEVMTNESNVTAAKAACDTKRKQNMDANPDDRWMHSWPRWYAPEPETDDEHHAYWNDMNERFSNPDDRCVSTLTLVLCGHVLRRH